MKSHRLETTTTKKGEKVIVDPEHTTERVMLWVSFYCQQLIERHSNHFSSIYLSTSEDS